MSKRYIDADALVKAIEDCSYATWSEGVNKAWWAQAVLVKDNLKRCIERQPTADVVEVRHGYNVGDFCLYGFLDGNKSLAIVEIVKILYDTRGIAEVKFHKVIRDNTGNGFFHYLFKSGGTMNASFKYLKNITPKSEG